MQLIVRFDDWIVLAADALAGPRADFRRFAA